MEDSGKKRIAAQNSFPDGGTNCHVLIEEFIPDDSYQQRHFPKIIPNMVKKRFPLHSSSISPVILVESEDRKGTNIYDFNKILRR